MNFIQENTKEVAFYTSLKDVEQWLEISLSDYDWHISDIESAWTELDDPSWITGKELSLKLEEFNYQFSWAVCSAFPKGSEPRKSESPYVDGNPSFWEGTPEKQMKDSLFEIVCWDSSATLFIGLPEILGVKLLKNAPGIKDLNKKNMVRKRDKMR